MNKKFLITSCAAILSSTLLLSGCEEESESKPVVQNQNINDMDHESQTKLEKDKTSTSHKLDMTKEQAKKYESDKEKLPKRIQKYVDDYIYAGVNKYQFVENYNKPINTTADYVAFANDSQKFKDLYKNSLENFAKKHKDQSIVVYKKNGQSLNFDAKNINVKLEKYIDHDFKDNDFVINETPTLLHVYNKKIKGVFVGYYDTDNLDNLITNLQKVGVK